MSGQTSQPAGDLQTVLSHAARLLQQQPELAVEQAREILRVVPGHADATLILGASLTAAGAPDEAITILTPLAEAHPKSVNVQFELGLALAEGGRGPDAVQALRKTVRLNGKHARAWRLLGDVLTAEGDEAGADQAYARHVEASVNDPVLMQAASALAENKLNQAETLLRDFLKAEPTDVVAIRMLAETGARLGRYGDAEALLARALELAPSFDAARYNYAVVLSRQNKTIETLAEVETLMARDPRNLAYRTLKAAMQARIGEYEQTIEGYEEVLKAHPEQPKGWMSYGHALKTVGRTEDGIAAYRRAISQLPSLGEAWWSLANLKTFRFSDDDIETMRGQLARADISDDDHMHLGFALGKALEDRADYAASFESYETANAKRRLMLRYDADETSRHVARSRALFTREFFDAREGQGCTARDPIFILGLTRSGSTLLEQILSSHSQVEGTMELPDISALAKRIGGRKMRGDENAYPDALANFSAEELGALGEEYLQRTRIQRKQGTPIFIDKMPSNWMHVGLIHLILPNARIIDARRHPMACCFSNFKQHFARGQGFTYGLNDLGRYYYDYVMMMGHFDAVLPGRIHRVFYEEMVADPEGQTRALLAACGLDFEPECLRFYENERAVRTASSEQVRRPIFKEGVDQWRHYEAWLGELKTALGDVLENYPQLPAI